MTLDEFIRKATERRRRRLWDFFGPVIVAVLLAWAYMPIGDLVASATVARFGEALSQLFRSLPPMVLVAATSAIIYYLGRRADRTLSVPCPHCATELVNHRFIVVATKNCPNCGRAVIRPEHSPS